MPFSDENLIRIHSGWNNTDLVTASLVAQRLADAHQVLLSALHPDYLASNDPRLILAETELATAFILRSLATEAGFEDRDIRTTQLTLRAGPRVRNLLELADSEESLAWNHARPLLVCAGSRIPLRLVSGS